VSEPTIYVVMRRDLGMRRGKEIAQACHAVLGLGASDSGPLIGLQVADFKGLQAILEEAEENGVGYYAVRDAGRTEIPSGTMTCAAIGPVQKGLLDRLSAAKLY
jgi:PTH2 family peptidyl-tRNA hydrolase